MHISFVYSILLYSLYNTEYVVVVGDRSEEMKISIRTLIAQWKQRKKQQGAESKGGKASSMHVC